MINNKFDVGVELKLLSLDTSISLESLALQYWQTMKQLDQVDPNSRNVYAIDCLYQAYFPNSMNEEYD